MQINSNDVIEKYMNELKNVRHELILRTLACENYEVENKNLKEEIEELNEELKELKDNTGLDNKENNGLDNKEDKKADETARVKNIN